MTNQNKTNLLETFVRDREYLAETAALHAAVGRAVKANVKTESFFPEVTACAEVLKDGVPLLQQPKYLDLASKSAADAFAGVLADLTNEDLASGVKTVAEAAKAWFTSLDDASKPAFFRDLLQQKPLTDLPEGVSAVFLSVVGWAVIDGLVPDEWKQHTLYTEKVWKRNYCPVCGRQPVLAHLRKEMEGRARFLVCDGCHTEWRYRRLGCVYCGNDDLKTIEILEPEDDNRIRLDGCEKCHAYLKTYTQEGEEAIFLNDWTTMPLDILGEQHGFHKVGSVMCKDR